MAGTPRISSLVALREKLWDRVAVQRQQLVLLRENRRELRDTCAAIRAQIDTPQQPTRALETGPHNALATSASETRPEDPARGSSPERRHRFRRRSAHRWLRKKGERRVEREPVGRSGEERLRRFLCDDDGVLPALRLHAGLRFADLHLRIEYGTQHLVFLPSPLGEFALRNGFDPERVLANEDKSCELIAAWYFAHIEEGGDPDPAVEALFRQLDVH